MYILSVRTHLIVLSRHTRHSIFSMCPLTPAVTDREKKSKFVNKGRKYVIYYYLI